MRQRTAPDTSVHFCRVNGRTFFLALRTNRYFCLQPHLEMSFGDILRGTATLDVARQFSALLEAKLACAEGAGLNLEPCHHSIPTNWWNSSGTETRYWRTARAILLRLTVRHEIKKKSLIELLRPRFPPGNARATSGLNQRLEQAVAAFRAARFVVPSLGCCLEESVALQRELYRVHVGADLVFGIRNDPFQAHCWVQYKDYALLDDPAELATFTPIAAFPL